MHGNVNSGLGKSAILTERLWTTFASSAIRRVQLAHDLTDQDLADVIGVCAATVGNARNQSGQLAGRTFCNLMAVDPMAFEGVLHHFGRRSVPIEARCNTDELVTTSAVVASIAKARSAKSPGGEKITDAELLRIEHEIDEAIESLSMLKMRAVDVRRERCA